jgi:hypothetical protein
MKRAGAATPCVAVAQDAAPAQGVDLVLNELQQPVAGRRQTPLHGWHAAARLAAARVAGQHGGQTAPGARP